MTFAWTRTFPDTHHGFVADEASQHVGRIKRVDGGPQGGTWSWTCTGCQRGHEAEGVQPLNGLAATRGAGRSVGPGESLERSGRAAAGVRMS